MTNFISWYIGAIGLGAFFAYLIVIIFARFNKPGSTRKYWSAMSQHIHGLLYGEEELYWIHYKKVISQTFRYVGRQLLGLVAAFVPLVAILFVASPLLFAKWDEGASFSVYPEGAGSLRMDAEGGSGGFILTLNSGLELPLPNIPGAQVLCPPGSIGCLILQGFAYKAHTVDQELSKISDLVIVRTAHNDWNPLWPYLSDPEFLFFVSLSVASMVLFIRRPEKMTHKGTKYEIEFVDYVLLQLAFLSPNLMKKLGRWESSFFSSRIGELPIKMPVFICGLARSGTTILLQKLANVPGIATHRYRDFPFIMMPLLWNKFLDIFARRQQPVERPHKDRIKITRDSPDAFEEPIWKCFFSDLHDSSKMHRMNMSTDDEEFAEFYRAHIKKILWIRHGSKYVSKGNYNLPRIEYIGEIFPDARFLIPVRHPLNHISSLVRQHKLFCEYAEADTKVPEYLRTVGHYEFGPQRAPICLFGDSAEKISRAWSGGDEYLGYAYQWAEIYRFVALLCKDNAMLRERIRIVRYEDLCGSPEETFERILCFIGAGDEELAAKLARGIVRPDREMKPLFGEQAAYWQTVGHVAEIFGYTSDPGELRPMSDILPSA